MAGLPRSSFVGSENLGEPPHFVKGVVERRRRDADYVRLAKIAFHTSGDKFFVQLLWMLVRLDRQLRAARTRVRWSDEREFL
jgi:hypothetical protein